MHKRNVDRDQNIVATWKIEGRKRSYELIARRFGVTRNVIAGVIFRHRHPPATLIASIGYPCRNKTGTGWRPKGYLPKQTAANTR